MWRVSIKLRLRTLKWEFHTVSTCRRRLLSFNFGTTEKHEHHSQFTGDTKTDSEQFRASARLPSGPSVTAGRSCPHWPWVAPPQSLVPDGWGPGHFIPWAAPPWWRPHTLPTLGEIVLAGWSHPPGSFSPPGPASVLCSHPCFHPHPLSESVASVLPATPDSPRGGEARFCLCRCLSL